MASPWAQANNSKTILNRHENIPLDAWTLDAATKHRGRKFCKIGLATQTDRAIDLSCRACGAGAGSWAWIPGWRPHASVFTPNLRKSFVVFLAFLSQEKLIDKQSVNHVQDADSLNGKHLISPQRGYSALQ